MTIENFDSQILLKNTNAIFVDRQAEDLVWLSLQVRGGSAYTTMTINEARKLIAALSSAVEGKNEPRP